MPKGYPWPKTTIIMIAIRLMQNDGYMPEVLARYTKERQDRISQKYIAKAKDQLHDLYALGLITLR